MSASPSPPPAASTSTAPAQQPNKDLYDEVFGGSGSELSDSESENERAPAIAKRKAFPPRAAAGASGSAGSQSDEDDEDAPAARASPSDDDDEEEGDADADGAYVPGTTTAAAKIPKFKKRRLHTGDDPDEDGDVDMDGEGEGAARVKDKSKKKKKKHRGERKRRDVGDGDGADGEAEDDLPSTLDPETQRRLELEARIDAIGKKSKTARRPKKDDVDAVDTYHDEICARLRERMMLAVEKDRQSNENKMPATAKLALLDEVMSVLRNSTLWTSVVDNGVLEAVRAWLEPMDTTAALPAVGIQNALFEVLPKMDIDTPTLKESRLGPIVLFYTKTKRVTPAINRAADGLVQAWSRPIIKRPNDFRTRHVDTVDDLPGGGEGRSSQGQSQSQGEGQSQGMGLGASQITQAQRRRRFDAAAAVRENHGRKGARLPQIKETQYTVAPESRLVHHAEDTAQVRKIQNDNKKFNKFARQLRMNKAR